MVVYNCLCRRLEKHDISVRKCVCFYFECRHMPTRAHNESLETVLIYDLVKKLIKSSAFSPQKVECIFLWRNSFTGLNFNYLENCCTCYFLADASTRTLCQNATREVSWNKQPTLIPTLESCLKCGWNQRHTRLKHRHFVEIGRLSSYSGTSHIWRNPIKPIYSSRISFQQHMFYFYHMPHSTNSIPPFFF